MRAPAAALVALACGAAAGCGGGAEQAGARTPAAAAKAAAAPRPPAGKPGAGGLVTMVTPSRLLPDLVGERGVVALEDGHKRVLVDRMRVVAHEDGSLERAAELLPVGQVNAIRLPSRLGGGYVFHASTRGGTQLWRAADWLGKLEPLVQLSSEAAEVLPGFDRLYVRLSQNNRLLAIDPQTGEAMPLGPLPPAGAYGQLVFADGWRAVVDADLRGPLATFDAGATWRAVDVDGRPNALAVVGGDPALIMPNGVYVIDARGAVTFRAAGGSPGAPKDAADEPAARPPGPFGRRPLRAAVEDGFPDSRTTAVVARGGALARVSLRDGAVLELVEEAYPDRQAACHAVRLGASFGFVCGERDGATAIHAFAPPLGMREVMRFKKPRFVSPSDTGALVVRGPCGDEAQAPGGRTYCVVGADGKTREIRVKAANQDLGVERVVALADGRVAVLVPPRAGVSGQLTVLRGTEATSVALALPSKPRSVARDLRRGMWLEGFQEREPGVLGGWVEAGGPIIGVRIDLKDGRVKAGEVRTDATGAVLSGRFALSLGDGDTAAESTDGGMTWTPVELPERDEDAGASPTRACGPAGCALEGWIRVGWGKPASQGDLAQAEAPTTLYTPLRTSVALSMQCEAVGSSTPPLPERPAPPPRRPPPQPAGRFGALMHGYQPPAEVVTAWLPFRNTAPPALGGDEVGFDNGAPQDIVALRAYVWGKRGADWARAGRWLVRFDDRFDPAGGVRSSAPSASPWPDEAQAAEAIGGYSYGMSSWGAFLDPGGRAALAQVCRGAGCSLFAVTDGQPALPLRDSTGRTGFFFRPFPYGAARLGDTWFFITPGSSYEVVTLWRADLGIARQLAAYSRPARSGHAAESPRLVRRALGGGLGLLVAMPPEPGMRAGTWHVLPIDRDTGKLGDAIPLGRKDLSDTPLGPCAPGQDGWQFDTTLEVTPNLDLGGTYGAVDSTELRLRMDPGVACVDSMAVRLQGAYVKATGPAAKPAVAPLEAIPLAATERASGKRWHLRCTRRGGFTAGRDASTPR